MNLPDTLLDMIGEYSNILFEKKYKPFQIIPKPICDKCKKGNHYLRKTQVLGIEYLQFKRNRKFYNLEYVKDNKDLDGTDGKELKWLWEQKCRNNNTKVKTYEMFKGSICTPCYLKYRKKKDVYKVS